jgi:UDP:flavonoid glycosyltransferase YjiC (YdhE family)
MRSVLWIPSFEPGSYFPAVPIALELLARGHNVTALCEAASEGVLRSLGCVFRCTKRTDSFQVEAGRPASTPAAKRLWFAGRMRALFADISQELSASAYDAVMVDPLELGAGFAAEASGVPWFSYAHFAMNETAADTPFCFHLWDRQQPADEAFVSWWNAMRAMVGLSSEQRSIPEHVWYRHSPQLTLICGLPELVNPKGVLPPYAVRVGPLLWEPPEDKAIPDWVSSIGRTRPAILASVSTLRDADLDLIVMVGEAAEGEGVDVVATIPGEHEMLPAMPGNVKVGPFIPHSALLGRVSLVACHAGYGTVTRAACAGVPQLLFPDGRDRFNVARGAVAAGVAVAIEPANRKMTVVRSAIQVLLADPSYRLHSESLARSARSYRAAVASADLVETLLRNSPETK